MNAAKLEAAVLAEGKRLANEVLAGRLSRGQLERAVEDTGDGEPAVALEILDGRREL